MASITFGEMADCDWLRGTFSGALLGFGKYNGNGNVSSTTALILKDKGKLHGLKADFQSSHEAPASACI